jgi:hypothetical protein
VARRGRRRRSALYSAPTSLTADDSPSSTATPHPLLFLIDAAARGVAAVVPNLLRLLRRQIDDAPIPFLSFPAVARRCNDGRKWGHRRP